ncbi:MAG TPA: methyltransferase [Acidobacteriota bacterium]|nr:methyltransferase [Acidobacteriota bacterium]
MRIPEVNADAGYIYDLIEAPIKTELLMTGLKLAVFDHLSDFVDAVQVAGAAGTHPPNTALLLDHLAMIDLVEKRNGLYRNRPIAETFLVSGNPAYLGPLCKSTVRHYQPVTARLEEIIVQGPPDSVSHEEAMGSPEFWSEHIKALVGWAYSGIALQMAGIIAELPEFRQMGRMLDLGGGPGIFAVAFVAAHEDLKAVVFDMPEVVKAAQKCIADHGMQDRISTMAGDYLTDDIGSGYDLIWASSTLSCAHGCLDELVAKIHGALNPGGLFACLAGGLTDERTKPDAMLAHIAMCMTGHDVRFDQGDIADAMLRVGFKSVRSRTIKAIAGPMELDIGRKAKH